MFSPNIKKKSLLGYDTSTVTFLQKLQEWAARNSFLKNSFSSQYINTDRNETHVRQDSSVYPYPPLHVQVMQRFAYQPLKKLDGVGPVDNRHSTDQLPNFVKKIQQDKKNCIYITRFRHIKSIAVSSVVNVLSCFYSEMEKDNFFYTSKV